MSSQTFSQQRIIAVVSCAVFFSRFLTAAADIFFVNRQGNANETSEYVFEFGSTGDCAKGTFFANKQDTENDKNGDVFELGGISECR